MTGLFSRSQPQPAASRRWLYLPLIAAVALSSLLSSWHSDNTPPLLPLLAITLGILICWPEWRTSPKMPQWRAVLASAALFVVPSYQLGWLTLSLLALFSGWQSPAGSRERTGWLIIGLAAAQPLITTYLLKWLAESVLSLDARLVAALLHWFTNQGDYLGNLVFGPADHQLLILRGCSSLTNLAGAWLGWFALARFLQLFRPAREATVWLLLAMAVVGLNISRLYLMGLDLQWHLWWHSPTGQQSYQFALSAQILLIYTWGVRYVGR